MSFGYMGSGRRARLKSAIAAAAAAAAASLLATPALCRAADTWTNGSGNRMWSSGLNWADGGEPTLADDVIFPTPIPAPALSDTVLISPGEFARSLTFNASYTLVPNVPSATLAVGNAGAVTVAAGQSATIGINLNGVNGLLSQGAGTLILTEANTYTGGTTVATGTLQLGNGGTGGSISGNVTVNNLATLAFNHSTPTTAYVNVISGLGGVNKLSTNLLAFTADHSYLGGTTISAGTLQLGNGGTTGSIIGNVVNNATLAFQRADDITFGYVISSSGGVSKLGSNTLTLTGNNTYTGVTTIASGGTVQIGNGAATGAIAGNVNAASSATLRFNRSDDVTYGGVISGGQLVKLGGNKLTLTGNSSPFGTTISAGTLQLGDGGSTGTVSSNVTNNGTLVFNRSDDHTFAGAISSTGGVVKLGANTVTMTGEHTYTGGTTIAAGTLRIGIGGLNGSLVGDVVNNGALVFNTAGTKTFAGVISGGGAVTKEAASNMLVLTGNNTYTGGTTISGGFLQIGAGSTSGSIVGNVANSGTLVFNRSDDITFAGVVSGSGGLTKSAGGAATLVLTGNHTYTGGTSISSGTLQLGNGGTTGSLASGSVAVTGGTFAINRSDDLTFNGNISGTGGLLKLGPNKLTLPGDYFYTGGTTIAAGTLQLGTGGSTGSVTGNVVDHGTLIFNSNVFRTFAGVISGSGSVTKLAGNLLILTGNHTYTGPTTISAGTLRVGAGSTSGSIVGDVVTNAELEFDRSDDITFGGVISGSGVLSKLGSNTLTLTGNNTYSGSTFVSGGTLLLTKPYTSGSALFLFNGAVARLAHSATTPNNVVLKTGAIHNNISGKLDVMDNKLIVAGGSIGTFSGGAYSGVSGLIASGYHGGAWDRPGITTSMPEAGPAIGTMTLGISTAQAASYAGRTFGGVSVSSGDVLVMYTYAGDLNLDGLVDAQDYGIIDNWVQFPGTSGYANGDINYDGVIDAADYGIIDNTIQLQGPPIPSGAGVAGAQGVTPVPEPCSVAIVMASLTGVLIRRRRRAPGDSQG